MSEEIVQSGAGKRMLSKLKKGWFCAKCGMFESPGSFIISQGIGSGKFKWGLVCSPCRQKRKKAKRVTLSGVAKTMAVSANARAPEGSGKITPEQVFQKFSYYRWKCWYCGDPYEQMDHIIPLSEGGKNMIVNCVPSCRVCNQRKGAKRLSLREIYKIKAFLYRWHALKG